MASAEEHPLVVPLASGGPLSLGSVTLNRVKVERFDKFELTFEMSGPWDNPFDPNQIDIWGDFTSSSGKCLSIPAFFYQAYDRSKGGEGMTEQLNRSGRPLWKIRFCPAEVGAYSCGIRANAGGQAIRYGDISFECVPSDRKGFIRLAKANPAYFEFDDGSLFYAVGENMCWPGPAGRFGCSGGTYDYDLWCGRLKEAGGNCIRTWLRPAWDHCLEISEKWRSDAGAGKYKQDTAWRLDHIIELCRENGIQVMFCMDSFNMLRRIDPYPAWNIQPCAVENGGWIKEPREFFTDEKARDLTKRKLRYIIARWGYSTSLWAWEFWNEVDIIEQYEPENVAKWHDEMSAEIRRLDPFNHLVTTSYAGWNAGAEIDRLAGIDFVQSHAYGAKDFPALVSSVHARKSKAFGKPHLFGEFGVGYASENEFKKNPQESDPDGLVMHNVAWSSIASGAAGSGMVWYWNDYVHPLGLYDVLTPAARFVADLPLNTRRFSPLEVENLVWADPARAIPRRSVDLLPANPSWEKSPQNAPNQFELTSGGKLSPADLLPGIFHGIRNHPSLHNPAIFVVDFPTDGRFVINLNTVSEYGGANLNISLDHRPVIFKDFPDDGSRLLLRLGSYTCHAGDYSIAVPKGRHIISVENTGNDWFLVRNFRFESEFQTEGPQLRVMGIRSDDLAVGWIQNTAHTWHNRLAGVPIEEQPPGRLTLVGFTDGKWLLRLYDTYAGKWLTSEIIEAAGGRLSFTTPPTMNDFAFRVERGGNMQLQE
ncbi:MAG TPA: DUF5060 domain-containing protein [Candidatus Brocadiia bacterium]|nr:DUF5060 domain-containing protein [Candidatus Brocadiia bacterium]